MISAVVLSIGQCALLLGVCKKTLRRWDASGVFKASFRTSGGHRRYGKKRVLLFYKGKEENGREAPRGQKKAAIYGRVSSSRQKKSGDLTRQLEGLKTYCKAKSYRLWKVYSDIGSGLNDKRKGLQRLLKAATCGQFDVLVVSYNDRLARFGLQIIKEYLASWGVELDVRHPTMIENSPHSELITDLTAILYSFMGKLYRMRRTT